LLVIEVRNGMQWPLNRALRKDEGLAFEGAPPQRWSLMIFGPHRFGALVTVLALAGCSEAADHAPPPRPSPPPVIRPVAQTPPAEMPQLSANWEDWPYTPGNWSYLQSGPLTSAAYGAAGSAPLFVVQCNRSAMRISFLRLGNFPEGDTGRMTIRATTGLQTYAVANQTTEPPYIAVATAPSDPHLDAMAFSRGRFVVSVKGTRDLVIPSWQELTRVIEDCR
jgi:hypothetical protein